MSLAATERADEHLADPPPAFAWRAVSAIAGLVAAAHLALSFVGGYWFDEVYMLAIGRHHLDWGSADQPPMTPLLAKVTDWIAPGSLVVLRLPAVLATAAAVFVAGLIARELGGDRRAQVFTAGAQATALWVALDGHWLTPYTLEPVQWLTMVWLILRWLRLRDDRLLIALGVVAGIAAETKFQVFLLSAVLLVAVAIFGPRELLRRPLLWVGAGIGVVLALPTLLWQAGHGWPQLKMGSIVTSEAQALYGGRPGVGAALVVLAGVAGTVLMIYGLVRSLRERQLRFLGVTFLALYAFFVIVAGRPYYLDGLYGALAAVGAVGLQRRREAGHRRARWLAWPAYVVSACAALGLLYASVTAVRSDAGEKIAQRAATAYHALPAAQREHAVIMGQSYILAAYVDGYADRYHLPGAYSGNRSYGYFPPPADDRDSVVFLGASPEQLRPYFASIRKVADGGPDASVWVATGRQQSWASIWPKLRGLTVG